MISVFFSARKNSRSRKSSSKFAQPTQGEAEMPSAMLNSLKASWMPYIGTYLKRKKIGHAGRMIR